MKIHFDQMNSIQYRGIHNKNQIIEERYESKGSCTVLKGRWETVMPPTDPNKWMLKQLSNIAPTHTLEGWKTSILRKQLGLEKNKDDKSVQDVTTHANDAIALAASRFIQYKAFHTTNSHGHHSHGSVELTDAPFKVITRPQLYRRQLHFENPGKGGIRKRKGGTVTPFGFRSGDLVQATKGKLTVKGYIGGYSEVNKVVSIYNVNWKRLGQFSVSKTNLLRRSNGLCIA